MELNEIKQMLDRIEQLRTQKGISKTLMYERSKTSSSALSQWRTGRTHPSQTSIYALAQVLDTTPEYLIYGIKKEAPIETDERNNSRFSMLKSLFEQLPPEDQNDVIFQLLTKVQGRINQDNH